MLRLSPRAQRLLFIFHLLELDWQKIWDFQNGRCGICKRPLKKANVDHRHSDGRINGLLCPSCNRALGRFHDDPQLLAAALEFLTNPPATQALGEERFGLPGRVGTKKQRKLIREMKKKMHLLYENLLTKCR